MFPSPSEINLKTAAVCLNVTLSSAKFSQRLLFVCVARRTKLDSKLSNFKASLRCFTNAFRHWMWKHIRFHFGRFCIFNVHIPLGTYETRHTAFLFFFFFFYSRHFIAANPFHL